ncbi:hypothetical protein BDY17DRAFT_324684 [Neohortaea acidophila]|uniref:Xylanolytic transcriptional activator regulatory domain-containing protein n=1 Tax=Neohortaea acidophila TaxID=245834 RepID=A0A6A6PQK7_9PEZI|nr:uncharacterized protein BDY17DRAFT_324684 [Neohortaea acidophila]KAF2482398.1 hypothetical protein BDY17DRAFT_324684 [Neohortaea acidophila]
MSAALRGPEADIRPEDIGDTTRGDRSIFQTNLHTPISQDLEQSSVEATGTTATTLDELAHIHDFSTSVPRAPSPTPPSTASGPDIFRGLVSEERLEELLDEYRPMSSAFPFVPVKPSEQVCTLRSSKPMLLLAIAAAASSKDRALQAALDQRYREELASHTIIAPRKSTGLVQSLLVYLAWYHHFFSHKTQNIFPLLQLLIGLVIDVGLHQDKGRKALVETSLEQQRERDRALLGCYFLSSTISAALRKTALFKKPDIFEACLLRLREGAEFESDATIETLVSWRHLDDQVNELCQKLRSQTSVSPDEDLRSVDANMHHYHQDLAGNIGNDVVRTPELLFYFAKMELCNAVVQYGNDLGDSSRTAEYNSIKTIECLDAGRSFLETLLEHSVHVYHQIPFVVWMRLPLIIITLTALTLSPDAAAPDRSIRLELYLEALCSRMQTLTTCCPPHQPLPDFWKAMFVIMDQARTWYVSRARSLAPTSETSVQAKPALFSPVSHYTELPGNVLTGHSDMFPGESAHGDVSSHFDDFMTLDLWGGSEGYDPTILNLDDIIQ